MLGTSGDEDIDLGPFYTPACPGHRGRFGGVKPPPPMVPPMQNSGPLACVEYNLPCHRTVRQGEERKRRRLVEEDLRESSERAFQAYG